jgi:hypothetical protein
MSKKKRELVVSLPWHLMRLRKVATLHERLEKPDVAIPYDVMSLYTAVTMWQIAPILMRNRPPRAAFLSTDDNSKTISHICYLAILITHYIQCGMWRDG